MMDTMTNDIHTRGPSPRWRFLTAAALLASVLAACAPTAPAPVGSPPDVATLSFLKGSVFGQQLLNESAQIAAGQRQPVLEFTVEDTPPSIFVNYIVPDAQAAAFASFVALPPGFTLAKVQILESDPAPRYWLSLNVYRVSGITTGLRAEWSTYVDDGSGVPRFMIIRARASEGSIDPIGPLALPEPFTHSFGADQVIRTAMNRTVVGPSSVSVTPDNLFNSTITLPAAADRNFVLPTREWVEANDFIYWRNGVNDRIFHNSTSHSPPLVSVDLANVTLSDDTEWAPFVDPVPGHVLVYLDKLQFMIGPWWNVTAPDGRVDAATRSSLLDLKKTMYGGLSSISALSVIGGNAEPILQTAIDDAPSSVNWHWKIPAGQLAAFQAAVTLPPGLSLSTIRLQDDDVAAANWLTLHVYRETGAASGVRAEWSTYVTDGTRTRSLILESRANFAALDPVNFSTTPYPVAHTVGDGSAATTVGSGPTAFSSSFALPPTGTVATIRASREWVGSGDLRYWSNGVADRVFYDSTVFNPKTAIDPATATITNGGQWAAFADSSPDRVWVDRAGVDQVVNPWWNLKSL